MKREEEPILCCAWAFSFDDVNVMTSGHFASGWAPLPKARKHILGGWICLSKDLGSGRQRDWAWGRKWLRVTAGEGGGHG